MNLDRLKQHIAQIQCDCDRIWMAGQLRALYAESDDATYQVQLAELLRFACPPDQVIRGMHGYFAGCAGGGANNTSVHKNHVATIGDGKNKETGRHILGGMQHEIFLHEHERDAKGFTQRYGAKAYKTLHDNLSHNAQKGADTLTAKDKATLKAELKATTAKAAALEAQGKSAAHYRAEALMLQRQLNRAGMKSGGKSVYTSQQASNDLKPIIRDTNARVDAYAKMDPYLVHRIYGTTQLRPALERFTQKDLLDGVRLVQSRHPGTKPTNMSSRASLVNYLMAHVLNDEGVRHNNTDNAEGTTFKSPGSRADAQRIHDEAVQSMKSSSTTIPKGNKQASRFILSDVTRRLQETHARLRALETL